MKGACYLASVTCLVLAFTTSAGADLTRPELETFRGELLGFVGDFERLPRFDSQQIGRAQGEVETLSAQELELLRTSLSRIPNWQALPQVMASLAQAEQKRAASARSPRAVPDAGSTADLERFRSCGASRPCCRPSSMPAWIESR
jgi:hypothetical protein